jgi:hypothetical protein
MARSFSLLAAAVVATLGVAASAHAGMIIAAFQEASGADGLFGTSSSGELVRGRSIGLPSDQFNPVAVSVRGQADFGPQGVLFDQGFEASIVAITDTGYEGTLTILVTYFDTLADPGALNLTSAFTVGDLVTGWTLTMENYGDLADLPFAQTIPLGSELFTTTGSATDVSPFTTLGSFFTLTTVFRLTAPTSGIVTATARITAEPATIAVPEPSTLAALAGALAGLAPWVARRRRPNQAHAFGARPANAVAGGPSAA